MSRRPSPLELVAHLGEKVRTAVHAETHRMPSWDRVRIERRTGERLTEPHVVCSGARHASTTLGTGYLLSSHPIRMMFRNGLETNLAVS
jgi:hypothetical protein